MSNPLAGLFTARQREAARRELYAGSLRRCGTHLAARGGPSTPREARLTQAVGAFAVALDGPSADPFDALLRVAERAVEAGDEAALALALDLAGHATRLRQRSRSAWRLHALALDGLGRDAEALDSYGRHAALLPDGGPAPGIARRIDTLRRRRACLDAAVALFPEAEAPPLDRPRAALEPELAVYVRARIDRYGAGDAKVRTLVRLYGDHQRLAERDAVPESAVGRTAPLGVTGLRGLLEGRSVCVVADGGVDGGVVGGGRGAEIDGYDVVVRCDAFRTEPVDTGSRTDLHAVTLRGNTPWEGPSWGQRARTRLVFGDPAGAWRRAVRQRLVPGAQEHVGDATLRRPLSDPALLGESGWEDQAGMGNSAEGAGTAFTVLRLLDFLDVSERLDLIGFDLPGRFGPREAAWIEEHARHIDDSETRIALR
ncbi:hypothetical protein ACIQNG_02295 [Streptomyces sp. NPDC091377]|uniref:hypothetical protein n=1 Tax=Streptomyces sp. NPDC091377 TaxID=3365995 RepID=UPI003813CDC2